MFKINDSYCFWMNLIKMFTIQTLKFNIKLQTINDKMRTED